MPFLARHEKKNDDDDDDDHDHDEKTTSRGLTSKHRAADPGASIGRALEGRHGKVRARNPRCVRVAQSMRQNVRAKGNQARQPGRKRRTTTNNNRTNFSDDATNDGKRIGAHQNGVR